jgi:hypothetical protein
MTFAICNLSLLVGAAGSCKLAIVNCKSGGLLAYLIGPVLSDFIAGSNDTLLFDRYSLLARATINQ